MRPLHLNPAISFHVSWLIASSALGVVAGIAAAVYAPSILDSAQYATILFALLVVGLRHRSIMRIPVFVFLGVCIGLWRGESLQQQLSGYDPYVGRNVTVNGRISEDTTMTIEGNQHLRLRDVTVESTALPGEVWASTKAAISIKRGDILTVDGQLSEGFGSLPASMHDVKIVDAKRAAFSDVPREVRDWFGSGVREAIHEPEASLGMGYLLGQRSTLPVDLDTNLKLLGLTHIVVASGYNLTILVRFARSAFARFSKYLATAAASSMIVGFLLVTGASPSMTRAAFVAGLSLAVWYFGRAVHPLVLLPFAAAITALIQPSFVWGDLGWYLSFVSFAGIMVLAPLLQHYFWGEDHPPGLLRRLVIETFSAQIATMPLIIFMFGQYSVLALPANVLILPLIPFTMLLTFLAGLGAIVTPFGYLIGLPATFLLEYMTTMITWLASLPWATGELHITFGMVIGSYGFLVGAVALMWRKTRHNFLRDNIVV